MLLMQLEDIFAQVIVAVDGDVGFQFFCDQKPDVGGVSSNLAAKSENLRGVLAKLRV